MSQIGADEDILSVPRGTPYGETTAEQDSSESAEQSLKLVPVSESIRYRRRAQSAEKKNEALAQALAEAKAESSRMSEKLSSMQLEHKLIRKLIAAGTTDLDAAVLIARDRMEDSQSQESTGHLAAGHLKEEDLDSVVKQLKGEKQYLFADERGGVVATQRTAPAKDRVTNSRTVIERAAKKAAMTGNRTDLQEYLKLRRSFV